MFENAFEKKNDESILHDNDLMPKYLWIAFEPEIACMTILQIGLSYFFLRCEILVNHRTASESEYM